MVKLTVLFLVALLGISNAYGATAYVKKGIELNVRSGPGKSYPVVTKLQGNEAVEVVSLDSKASGWIEINTQDGNRGYVSMLYLTGDYEQAFSNERTIAKSRRSAPTNIEFLNNLFALEWIAILILASVLALEFVIIHAVRKYDDDFDKPLLHYLIFFIGATVTVPICLMAVQLQKYNVGLMPRIIYFLLLLSACVITMHGGWGIRRCGMIDGERHRNANRHIGQFLMFMMWLLIMRSVWDSVISPIIDMSGSFTDQNYGIVGFIVALIIMAVIMGSVLFVFLYVITPRLLHIIGNNAITFTTLVLWWAMNMIGYNWIDVNFDNVGWIAALFVSGMTSLGVLSIVMNSFSESRCPMCHFFEGYQSNMVDHGISSRTTKSWESMNEMSITPEHSGAAVSEAKRLISKVEYTHSWTTEHTCRRCGCVWTLTHSESAGSHSSEMQRKWKETWVQ